MMRIYSAFVAHRASDTPQHVARAENAIARNAGVWFCLLVWIACAWLIGYYAHYYWLQRHPRVNSEVTVKAAEDYHLSDMHYVFKKQPLPARLAPEVPDDQPVDEDAETPAYDNVDDMPGDDTASEDGDMPSEEQARKDALREQVQKALAEIGD
ncbi:hypothetical protein SIL08_04245 [Scandinavium sp. V105_16]|uniref:Uncharacterized protein n=1 Tax=Scandinavium lactucae TaxID=3095028 RepID=A0AAJ2VV72_9ENTR|nr:MULTISPECIES: hypothetical protein [unclassified Scandinavium]MDX6019503.1 hypothetical protein [Scandinavium sp. V105_16]MDX6032743.1 hypothetical protein [Scandinavium sp. V105_12]